MSKKSLLIGTVGVSASIGLIYGMKKLVLGEIELKDMSKRERGIVEVLIYNKIRELPEDPHLNKDVWFWGKNLGSFTKRMKSSCNRIYIRLIDMVNSCSMPDWASFKVRGWEM